MNLGIILKRRQLVRSRRWTLIMATFDQIRARSLDRTIDRLRSPTPRCDGSPLRFGIGRRRPRIVVVYPLVLPCRCSIKSALTPQTFSKNVSIYFGLTLGRTDI